MASKSEGSNFWRYGWDHENRLVTASTRKNSVRYKYDALGRRIERDFQTGRERTKFTYDGDDVLLDDKVGTLTKYLNGLGINNKLRATTGSNASYFLADHLGSTNGLADGTGSVTSSASYDSFGNPSNRAFPSRYQFTGREFDSFTGMQYSRARWYDPKIGRFISEDPIGLTGGINQYIYVSNKSIGKTDPFGLYERDVHEMLTYYLAKQNGCFDDATAGAIAAGNQGTDDNPVTAPGFARDFTNSYYHALSPDARPGVGPDPMRPYLAINGATYFGQYLHYLQDTFSHQGFPNSTYGHMFRAHGNDKTATDVVKTVQMAQVTYGAISGYSQLKCGCEGKPWNDQMAATVRSFASERTWQPDLADIDGDTGLPLIGKVPFLGDPRALARKRSILGF
jgi:RHS repeat-associated protein